MNCLIIRIESFVRVYLSFLPFLTMGVAKNEGGNPILFYILGKRDTLNEAVWAKITENLAFKS
jgi:hypothetical protein